MAWSWIEWESIVVGAAQTLLFISHACVHSFPWCPWALLPQILKLSYHHHVRKNASNLIHKEPTAKTTMIRSLGRHPRTIVGRGLAHRCRAHELGMAQQAHGPGVRPRPAHVQADGPPRSGPILRELVQPSAGMHGCSPAQVGAQARTWGAGVDAVHDGPASHAVHRGSLRGLCEFMWHLGVFSSIWLTWHVGNGLVCSAAGS